MNPLTIRERLILRLYELSDEQLQEVIRYVEQLQKEADRRANYDPAKDSILHGGGLEGLPADVAERAEDILYGQPEEPEPEKQ